MHSRPSPPPPPRRQSAAAGGGNLASYGGREGQSTRSDFPLLPPPASLLSSAPVIEAAVRGQISPSPLRFVSSPALQAPPGRPSANCRPLGPHRCRPSRACPPPTSFRAWWRSPSASPAVVLPKPTAVSRMSPAFLIPARWRRRRPCPPFQERSQCGPCGPLPCLPRRPADTDQKFTGLAGRPAACASTGASRPASLCCFPTGADAGWTNPRYRLRMQDGCDLRSTRALSAGRTRLAS